MEKALEADALVHLLSERTYIASRRSSYLTVPGMSEHYPNINYPVPAQLLPGVHFQRPPRQDRSLFDIVRGRKIIKSYFALPVGRKPSAEQLQEHNERLIRGDVYSSSAKIRLVGYEDSDPDEAEEEDFDVLAAKMSKSMKINKIRPAGECAYFLHFVI